MPYPINPIRNPAPQLWVPGSTPTLVMPAPLPKYTSAINLNATSGGLEYASYNPGGTGGAVITWLPSALGSSLFGWFDANDTSTLTYSTGTSVAVWKDKSIAKNDLNTVTGSLPTWSATGRNGKPAMVFNSGAIYQTTAPVNGPSNNTSNGFTLCTVCYSGSGGAAKIAYGQPAAQQQVYIFASGSSNTQQVGLYGTNYQSNIAANTDIIDVWSMANTYSFSSSIWRYNGIPIDMTGQSTNNVNFPSPHMYLGGMYDGSSITDFLNGTIQEALFINRDTTATEMQKIEGYLANKWGLQASLPSNHPYKSTAPAP